MRGRDLVRQMLTFAERPSRRRSLSLEQYRQGDRDAHPGDHANNHQHQGRTPEIGA